MPSTIDIVNPFECRDWNRRLAGMTGATAFHTTNWASVLAESYGYTPRYFCATHNGTYSAIIPMMEVKSLFTGRRGVSLPFTDQVEPLFHEPGDVQPLLDQIMAFGRQHGWKTVRLRGYDDFLEPSKSIEEFISCVVELKPDHSEMFRSFKGNTRRNIKKAIRSDVQTRICGDRDDVKEFYRLNCMTRRAHGLPPQPFSFFEHIYHEMLESDMGFMCLGYHKEKVISGVMFFHFNGKAIYKFGVSDAAYLKLRPNNLVFWDALKHSAALGCGTVDLGRTEMHHKGLLQFKRSWGPVEKPLNYYSINPGSGEFETGRQSIKSSYNLFSKLPIPALKFLGNILYRHVG